MSHEINRIDSRVREIQTLLGESGGSNEEFGRELQRASDAIQPNPRGRSASAPVLPASLSPIVQEAAERTGLSPDLISAVIRTESGYRPDAVSRTGAKGLMQLMPGTARALGVTEPFDARQNVLGGSEYLAQQLAHFGSVEKALAAYNAGPGAVKKYDGVPPFAETQNYVRRVMDTLRRWTERKR